VEAEFDLRRVRAARHSLLNLAEERGTGGPIGQIMPSAVDPQKMETMLGKLPQVLRLDRYERRAMSRRKKALRALRG
jgi:hypothetical protein